MDNAERYRKELDLIFQGLDEKEQLRKQAESQPYAEFVNDLLRHKSIEELLQAVPVEDRIRFIDTCWQAKLATDNRTRVQKGPLGQP